MKFLSQNLFSGKIDLNEAPLPKLEENEVLIKSIYSLISSGTERSMIEFGKSNILKKINNNKERVKTVFDKISNDGLKTTLNAVIKKINKPIQIGYSNLGVVVDSRCQNFKVGDKVISNGFHAEYVKVGKNLCVHVPKEVDDLDAIFSILGSIALNGIRKLNTQINENIVIFGFGLIGNIVSKILKANGVNIFIVEIDENKRNEAEQNGYIFCNPKKNNWQSIILNNTKNYGCDGAIICSNSKNSEPIINAAKILRKLGKIVLIGEASIEIPRKLFYDKEIQFEISKSYGPGRYEYKYENLGLDYPYEYVRWTENRNIETILNLLKKKVISFDSLVYKTLKIDEFKEAYRIILSKTTHKAVIFKYENNSTPAINLKENRVKIRTTSNEFSSIGAGNQALSILFPLFKKKIKLGYICGNSSANLYNSLKKFGFKGSVENEDELYKNKNVKNLIINTPHHLHAESIIKCIKYNKNVFIEKPVAITIDQINNIIKCLKLNKTNPIIRTNYNRRYSPYIQTIKKNLLNLNSKKTIQININTKDYSQTAGWLSDKNKSGGIIIGEACHFIDLSKYIIEKEIQNFKINKTKNSDFQITLNFSDDSCSQINYFFTGTSKYPKEHIKIFSDNDVIEINNFKNFKSYKKNIKSNFFSTQDKGHENSIEDFIQKVGGQSIQKIEEILDDIDTARIAIILNENAG